MAVKKQFSNFQDLLANTTVPLLVDFYATWCGSCQMMTPILEKIKTQMGNRLQVVKIDADKYPQLASDYKIQALPTLILFQNGEQVLRIKGVMKAPQLIQKLEEYLSGG
ncbi:MULTISPECIES: thioredoxin [unclassified Coleofasciculus]|uniref:thioredoxin n=1 Tax=unclassified Coleofasciculus TaxID=2692782 RepID=UPI001881069F|nr:MULTISPECIES: thioredoxin [unclassified Coleofasciculus]MBE9127403.1 thioredoxin [Coleofasciculus sp. LEGE 07081]MBE9147171.1 thioredoxin [Coleofasciculus sp. LEGE 07092]